MKYTEIREKMRELGELFLTKYEKERGEKDWKLSMLNGITFYCSRDDEYKFDNELISFKVNNVDIYKFPSEEIEIRYTLNESNPNSMYVNVRGILDKIEDCLKNNTDFPESMEEFLLDTNKEIVKVEEKKVEPNDYKKVSAKAEILDKLLERDISILKDRAK